MDLGGGGHRTRSMLSPSTNVLNPNNKKKQNVVKISSEFMKNATSVQKSTIVKRRTHDREQKT